MTEIVDLFEDTLLASIYDDLNPWGRESGGGVLDLGCGAGLRAD